ncbi:alpha/beta-hydrolase [Neocallimastix lanati (nom. inval.)]|uniref:Alpha/beta-hydrolase n=1 Tax=Neocallimastix californiae TaxID=1754190 RepID=A0A1Y2ADM1_9FUNG|nr:alpha/beta-hydrolase [Neocallimastix sp. JGI-2020a]ORY20367.1 alpha/beta-hydrolase [Neocallimastix californiae]|eukprot:ORY20367.1 alpha/beta-hydrolase [Neocallimastix californiae]
MFICILKNILFKNLIKVNFIFIIKRTDIKYGGSYFGTLDVYYDENDINNLKPVIIYVHGGAWMFGNKNKNTGVGNLLIREGYIGVNPNYVLFSRGSMDDMVDNIYKAIQWTYKNISKYGGNKNKIILSGHSSGAHLAALTTFKSSLGIENNGKY